MILYIFVLAMMFVNMWGFYDDVKNKHKLAAVFSWLAVVCAIVWAISIKRSMPS